MKNIERLIFDNLNLRVFLPLFATGLATTWYGIFWSKAHFESLTGGTTFVDMQPGLTPASLFEQFRNYSDEAVSFYIGWNIFDYAWPLITFTTILFICAWLMKFVSDKWRQWFWVFIASAYTTVLMDWGENTGYLPLLALRPDEPALVALISVIIHNAKLVFLMIFNAATLALLLAVIATRVKNMCS